MLIALLLILSILLATGIGVAVRRQSKVTRSFSQEEQEEDARVYAESTKAMEATVAEVLADKARDPRLASMSDEDLVGHRRQPGVAGFVGKNLSDGCFHSLCRFGINPRVFFLFFLRERSSHFGLPAHGHPDSSRQENG